MPNLQERLRQAMRYTRLDADRELLNEAADEIDRRSGTHPAEVTRDEVMQAAKEATAPEWQDVVDGWHMGLDLMAFARAILALRPVQVPMTDERSVSVKVDRELFSFHSEQDWVNKARSRYANCGVQKGHYITVDAAGHVMHMGLCFKHAAYPVTVYQLQTNWPKEQA